MAAHVKFTELTGKERKSARTLPRVAKGDRVEVRVVRSAGGQETTPVPRQAAALIGSLLDHLARGEKVAVVAESQEVSPNEAAAILGMSRPLVVHRMDVGDLPFHYVGKHRRARLTDVLALKKKIDTQRGALRALAQETGKLMRHGV